MVQSAATLRTVTVTVEMRPLWWLALLRSLARAVLVLLYWLGVLSEERALALFARLLRRGHRLRVQGGPWRRL